MLFATYASRVHRWLCFKGVAGRRLALLATLAAIAVAALAVPSASADFGFKQLGVTFTEEDGFAATRAGSHPFAWTIELGLNTRLDSDGEKVPDQDLKDLRIVLPAGLVGTPALLPRCPEAIPDIEDCPAAAAVGKVELSTADVKTEGEEFTLYNMVPPYGSAAQLGFSVFGVQVRMRVAIDPDPPHNLVASLADVPQVDSFFGSVLTVHGIPGGTPFLTLPRSCSGPLTTIFEADSWQQPGAWTPPAILETDPQPPFGLSGCDELAFDPAVSVQPTSTAAQAPSGLHFSLGAPDKGLASPAGIARADLSETVFTLPEGMTVNASVATGLGACTLADYSRETLDTAPGAGCPEAAKIGTAAVESPLLEEPVAGSLYVAQPDDPATDRPGAENPVDSLLALYVVFRNSKLGVLVKQAIKIAADPVTGRLTTSIEDIPQLPISHLELHLRDGPRSPLVTPPGCGSHGSGYRLTPSSGGPPLGGESSFALDKGCVPPGFQPGLLAGTTVARAGAASPFVLSLTRSDGEQNPSALSLTLPRGVSANFGAVPLCPEGRAAGGACPASTRIGSIQLAAGAGATPVRIPGAGGPSSPAYLAGPYKGAPFSLVAAVPAQAGPFDLGTIATRAAIFIDPVTAQARIRLDPLPQILDGIPIAYREIDLVVDRAGFVRNPTSCAATAVRATVTSVAGTIATASNRFQVGGCGHLPFEPKVDVWLLGPSHRGAHPRFRTVLTTRRRDANIRRLAVTLPGAVLLDNRHIGDVCTRAEFAAARCSTDAIYGRAKAWTPLLERPLEGPIYLRESKTRLPELAVALGGRLQLDLIGRVDSVRGHLRSTFGALPDVPLSKVALTMKGGRRDCSSTPAGSAPAGIGLPPASSATTPGGSTSTRS